MHYIKLLRPPEVERTRPESSVLKIVLAITTDLGDAYLSPKDPIDLVVIGAYTSQKDGQDQLIPVNLTPQPNVPKWRSGMRVLKFNVPLPPQQPITTIQIRPLNRQLTALGTTDIYPPTGQGLIMAAFSDIGHKDSVCFRSLRLPTPEKPTPEKPTPENQTLQVEEDMGDSIARHIWDSGIATTSLIADMLFVKTDSKDDTPMPSFRSLLQQRETALKILEIGCGIGTLGIAMARMLGHQASTTTIPAPKILMTDLPEAEERARANIARQSPVSASLDFEALDWEDGKAGVFGEKVQAESWDLVIVSDCTYNTDTLMPLVQTLSAVHKHSYSSAAAGGEKGNGKGQGPKIFLATKSRHSSEREFFDLMAGDGWEIEEEAVMPLPHIDGEGKPIEVYLFVKKGE